MNSSTGFKKRSLLRPPSGMREREREFLKSIDISQSETMILNQLKTEIGRIQQEINILDQDRKIRTGEGSSLQKSYVLTLRKWLRDNSFSTSEKQDDDFRVMKSLNVQSYENGFKKLWRLLVGLDQILCKATELQIVQMLKYDDAFISLSQDSQKSANILSTMGKTGFSPSTFQLTHVLLERNKDLFSLLLQGKHQSSKQKRGSLLGETMTKQASKKQTNELIEQLRKQNEKLNDLLAQLDKEKETNRKLKKELQLKQQIIAQKQKSSTSNTQSVLISASNKSSSSPSSSGQAFAMLEDRYTERMTYLSQQIAKLQSQLTQQKVTITTLQKRAKMAEDQLKQTDKSKSFRPKQGSYEQALMQEMEKMRRGFEKKIKNLLQEHAQKEKQMRAKQIQYRAQNDKIRWQKGLLLKKFQAIEIAQKGAK